mmetsp:Transcript_10188/g.41991  ORF Transcript_10188/g.41991 Transcript_10188/m.41991 type:complete len:235 (+) Transcript_10188:438-1142(+)
MARARRFIERVHPKLLRDGLRARTSLPRRRDPFSRLSRHATDDADVHGGWREVRGQGVHLVGGRATVLEPRGAIRRPRRRRRRRFARSGEVLGGDWSGLDPARVGVRVGEGDAGEGARSGRRWGRAARWGTRRGDGAAAEAETETGTRGRGGQSSRRRFLRSGSGSAAAARSGRDAHVDGFRRARREEGAGYVRERPGGGHRRAARGRAVTDGRAGGYALGEMILRLILIAREY